MNRYMAILEDYDDLDRIGSVRSCRTCYVYFAREFDAVYAHYGQSDFAKPYLKHIDNINGLEAIGTTAYYRSKDRKAPHNAYTGGDRLKLAIRTLGYSDAYDSGYKGHYLFARDGCVLTLDDRPGVIQRCAQSRDIQAIRLIFSMMLPTAFTIATSMVRFIREARGR